MKRLFYIVIIMLLTSCWQESPRVAPHKSLLLGVSSSSQPILSELGKKFQEQEGIYIKFIKYSSGELVQSIENGVPVDLFFSANSDFIQAVSEHTVKSKHWATSELMVVGPVTYKDSSLNRMMKDQKESSIIIANPRFAPYGKISKAYLEKEFPNHKTSQTIKGKSIAYVNVYLSEKASNMGITSPAYHSILKDDFACKIVENPNYKINHHVAILKGRKMNEAEMFYGFLESKEAQEIIKSFHFEPAK